MSKTPAPIDAHYRTTVLLQTTLEKARGDEWREASAKLKTLVGAGAPLGALEMPTLLSVLAADAPGSRALIKKAAETAQQEGRALDAGYQKLDAALESVGKPLTRSPRQSPAAELQQQSPVTTPRTSTVHAATPGLTTAAPTSVLSMYKSGTLSR